MPATKAIKTTKTQIQYTNYKTCQMQNKMISSQDVLAMGKKALYMNRMKKLHHSVDWILIDILTI